MELYADRLNQLGWQNEFKVVDDIRQAEANGRDVVRLNLGEPDFDAAENINQRAMAEIAAGNSHYCDPQGVLPLRQAVATHMQKTRGITVSPDQVVITSGGKPPLSYSFLTYVNPGDEVIYPAPGFPAYEAWAGFCQAEKKPLPLLEGKGFRFDPADLAALVNKKTKLLILNSPSNPTGGVLTLEDLQATAEIMERQAHPDYRILTDEVYEEILFDGNQHHSISSLPGMDQRAIVLSCHSKTYAMTGWRVGYAVLPSVAEAQAFRLWNINTYSCTPPFVQAAAQEALENPANQAIVAHMRAKFQERRDAVIPALNAIPGISCVNPGGAFYAFPNVSEAVANLGAVDHCQANPGSPAPSTLFQLFALHVHGVATLDRNAFGRIDCADQHYIRISLASDLDTLMKGVDRLRAAATDKEGFQRFLATRTQG